MRMKSDFIHYPEIRILRKQHFHLLRLPSAAVDAFCLD
jgi:hypothetical protein